MASGNSTPSDFGAFMRRSWEDPGAEDKSERSAESSSFERAAFGLQAVSSGGESSHRSDGAGRFASSFHHRFETDGVAGEQYGHEEEEDDGGEDEEDDDHVRQSWTTEKEPAEERYVASFRFREDKQAYREEEEEEDGDSDASFGSLEWVTRQLRQLERRKEASEDDGGESYDDDEEEKEGDEEDHHEEGGVDSTVREALSLLNGGGASGEDEDEWRRGAEERRGSYFDIVQEAMATEWQRNQYDPHEDHHDGEDAAHHQQEMQEEAVEDEWLEAFTAKGRVYYYNRRTRESSWTKPDTFHAPTSETGDVDNHYETTREETHEEAQNGRDEPSDHEPEDHLFEQQENNQRESPRRVMEHSSTSSTASSNHQPEASVVRTDTSSNVLFCCFCGSKLAGASGFQTHMSTCKTLQFHKESASTLYTQFQHMLVLLSEDASLRVLHYASSFPDAKPHPQGIAPPERAEQSVRESLTLLHAKHRSTRKPLIHKSREDDRAPLSHPAQRLSLSSNASSRKREASSREPRSSRHASVKQKPTPVAQLNMETCRHCGRSFAEGRLAKHEAVCPRVFGSETAWGRGPPTSVQKNPVGESEQQRHEHLLRSLKKKHHANLKHTLALSFQEHQASLVECPCCRRKFAPSGAQQHIDICKTVQHRPRNPVPLLKDFALAG